MKKKIVSVLLVAYGCIYVYRLWKQERQQKI